MAKPFIPNEGERRCIAGLVELAFKVRSVQDEETASKLIDLKTKALAGLPKIDPPPASAPAPEEKK
jgi:hypothetical protein